MAGPNGLASEEDEEEGLSHADRRFLMTVDDDSYEDSTSGPEEDGLEEEEETDG